jgi:Secretion system C-terminal sorting domain
VSSGIQGNNVNDLYVYQSELYAVGVFTAVGNVPSSYIGKWNGSSWANVSTGIDYGNAAMIEWKGKLIVGSQLTNLPPYLQVVNQWDGTAWTQFSKQHMINIRKFFVFDNKLYCTGGITTGAAGVSYVYVWDEISSLWKTVGKGINAYSQSLCEYNGEFYCGGSFTKPQGGYHNYIAKLANVTGMSETSKKSLSVTLFPNPSNQQQTLSVESEEIEPLTIRLYDALGRLIKVVYDGKTCVGESSIFVELGDLPNSVYVYDIRIGEKSGHIRFIKN